MPRQNAFGQPVGDPVPDWEPARLPGAQRLAGHHGVLEPLDAARHAAELYAAYEAAPDERDWTYMSAGPFSDEESYRGWADEAAKSRDPRHYAVIDGATGRPLGTLALMRQDPANGVIEVGSVAYSRALQRTPLATEAQFLLMRYAFDELGYRRYEWKCDSLNQPSRRAAQRLGFSYEGTFRQAVVYKGRNRDTAWFSITDEEWPRVRERIQAWLAPSNFDAEGRQRHSLRAGPALPVDGTAARG